MNVKKCVEIEDLRDELNGLIEDTVYAHLLNVDIDDDFADTEIDGANIYDNYSRDEINVFIADLSKKKRKEFLTVMTTYYDVVKTLDIQIDKNYYNLVSFCADLKDKSKKLSDYLDNI